MNNTSKVLVASLALALAFVAMPTTAQTSAMYGTQVLKETREFTPTMLIVEDLAGAAWFRHNADTETNAFDDVIVLETDAGADGEPERNDLVIATSGYDGSQLGKVLKASQDEIVGATLDTGTVGSVWYVDVNENGFYDAGDGVIACSGAVAVAATNLDDWCIYLTKVGSNNAGSFVRSGHPVLVGQVSLVTDASTDAQLVRYASADPLDVFNPLDHPGDLMWLDVTGAVALDGETLPLYAIELYGGTMGRQVMVGDAAFTITVEDLTALTIYRCDAGTATNHFDDVIILEASGDVAVSQNDVVLATSGYAGTQLGKIVTDAMTQLITSCATPKDATGTTADVSSVDVNENGRFDAEDGILLGTDCTAATGDGTFCIYLTKIGNNAVGSFVRTNHDVIVGQADLVGALVTGDVLFFDPQNTGLDFNANEFPDQRLWIEGPAPLVATDTVPLFAVEVFGGQMGRIVTAASNDFTLTLSESLMFDGTDFAILRYNAATADNLFDDVIVADLDASGDASQNDFVLATSGYAGTKLGAPITDAMTQLDGKTPNTCYNDVGAGDCSPVGAGGLEVAFFFVDNNENGFYDTADSVILCGMDGTDFDPLLATTGQVIATNAADFCIYMTKHGSHNAGSFVRSGHDVLVSQGDLAIIFSDDATVVHGLFSYYDPSNTPAFNPTEFDNTFAWFIPFDFAEDFVPLYAIRAYGDFSKVPTGGGQDPVTPATTVTPTTPTDVTPVTPTDVTPVSPTGVTPTPPTVTPPTMTPPTQTTDGDDDDDGAGAPGFELVALVAALGVALVLVRRKL